MKLRELNLNPNTKSNKRPSVAKKNPKKDKKVPGEEGEDEKEEENVK